MRPGNISPDWFHHFLLECLWVTQPACCWLLCNFTCDNITAGREAEFGSILMFGTQQSCMFNGWSTSVLCDATSDGRAWGSVMALDGRYHIMCRLLHRIDRTDHLEQKSNKSIEPTNRRASEVMCKILDFWADKHWPTNQQISNTPFFSDWYKNKLNNRRQ